MVSLCSYRLASNPQNLVQQVSIVFLMQYRKKKYFYLKAVRTTFVSKKNGSIHRKVGIIMYSSFQVWFTLKYTEKVKRGGKHLTLLRKYFKVLKYFHCLVSEMMLCKVFHNDGRWSEFKSHFIVFGVGNICFCCYKTSRTFTNSISLFEFTWGTTPQ